MKIDRTAFASDNVVALGAFKNSCLGCPDCTGLCRPYLDLMYLPGAVLKAHRDSA